jgi:hypothetical protein
MGVKAYAAKWLAARIEKETRKWSSDPRGAQQKVFLSLLSQAKNTLFGEDHEFERITNYKDFKDAVPVRDYEGLKPYIKKILDGEDNVLWTGKPLYFAKTSGTTSGVKYIPISKESMPYHIAGARNALLSYIYESRKAAFVEGNMIFLSGSPVLEEKSGIPTGRLSGIVNHHIPGYLRRNQMPTYETNCIEDWEEKLEKIVAETLNKNMTLISGIPPWMQMYFDRLTEKAHKPIGQLFPNLSVIVHGGVNFAPYKDKLFHSIGRPVAAIETFPASEGFIAYQNRQHEEGLLLLLDSGIFYEFIPADEIFSEKPTRLSIADVEPGVNYALIMNTNAGLWGYNIGDTVKFVSVNPYKIVVTGRIKHFISAFGEHVIAEEVEQSLAETAREFHVKVIEFTVAPQVNPQEGLPHHEWFVEFENLPDDTDKFRSSLDEKLQKRNIYYKDLIEGRILEPLHLSNIQKDGFIDYMKSIGKLGGQNKLPRLSNDRTIADALKPYLSEILTIK